MARPKEKNRENVRSERVSLVLTPANYDGINALAQIFGCSVNDVLNSVVEEIVKKNFDAITKYKAVVASARADVNLDVNLSVEGGDLNAQN